MEEHLTIRNFGPIREAEIGVRDLTIFVGPQATGKSLAAQALYFLRGVEDLTLPEANKPFEKVEVALSTLEWWFGNTPPIYAGPGTLLRWRSAQATEEAGHGIQWDHDGAHLSKSLASRIVERKIMGRKPGLIPEQVYIPAGRSLYSFLPPYLFPILFSRRTRPQWPGHVLTFYDTLGAMIEQLWRVQETGQMALFDFFSDSEIAFLQQRVTPILKGHIRYGPETVLLETDGKLLRPATIAAGQMEIWPFWAIVEGGLRFGIVPSTQIYFEEPEAHLHPGAQRSVMEIVAFLVKRGVRFLITTHSPYILYAVNNFLMAQKVLDAGRTLPDEVSPETALRPDQVAAYRFSPDGTVHDIMDAEVGLIDGDELERVADDLGSAFVDLQERLEGMA